MVNFNMLKVQILSLPQTSRISFPCLYPRAIPETGLAVHAASAGTEAGAWTPAGSCGP